MDLALTEEQQLLKNSARDFFEKELPKETVKELEADPLGYSPELWNKTAELGWCGLTIPEQYGGAEFGYMELVMLLGEMGRACLPGPFFSTVVLCAPVIITAGSEQQKAKLLPKIATGDVILSLALTEPSATYDPSGITTTATADNDSYILNGTKLFVHDAHCADYILCIARTDASSRPDQGISIFLVDPKTPGITITPLETISNDHQNEVVFVNVAVPAENMIGGINQGWPVIKKVLEEAAVAKCAEMIGGCEYVVEITVAYAKERVQYDQPIGSFQAIQHYLADMYTQSGMATWLTYHAASVIADGEPCSKESAAAKAWCNEAYKHCTRMAVQIHGGIGMTIEHDVGLYYRRAKQAALLFADTDTCNEIVAQGIGL